MWWALKIPASRYNHLNVICLDCIRICEHTYVFSFDVCCAKEYEPIRNIIISAKNALFTVHLSQIHASIRTFDGLLSYHLIAKVLITLEKEKKLNGNEQTAAKSHTLELYLNWSCMHFVNEPRSLEGSYTRECIKKIMMIRILVFGVTVSIAKYAVDHRDSCMFYRAPYVQFVREYKRKSEQMSKQLFSKTIPNWSICF